MGTDIELLVIEGFFLRKEDQDPSLVENYKDKYELDCRAPKGKER